MQMKTCLLSAFATLTLFALPSAALAEQPIEQDPMQNSTLPQIYAADTSDTEYGILIEKTHPTELSEKSDADTAMESNESFTQIAVSESDDSETPSL